MDKLTKVWESYECNDCGCVAFLTKEAAESHNLFEVGWVRECKIYLSEKEIQELNENNFVWLQSSSNN